MHILSKVMARPLTVRRSLIGSLIGAVFTALCTQMVFYIPGKPIPITMQVFAVVCCALFLGGRYAALAQIQYVGAGLLGAPIFTGHSAGLIALKGLTGGYLIGFVVAAYVAGTLFEHAPVKNFLTACMAGVVGVALIHGFGVGWLAVFHGSSFPGFNVWLVGAAPFIGIDAMKVAAAAMLCARKSGNPSI